MLYQALLVGIAVSAFAERSFLSLDPVLDPDEIQWDTIDCPIPLTDISFSPPGATGLTTGKLTLSSVSIGEMSRFSLPPGRTYSDLPVKAYNLTLLNKYGKCLGLKAASSVMDWAEAYKLHLGATRCDGKGKEWVPCAEYIDSGLIDAKDADVLERKDFVMISPMAQRLEKGYDSRSFAAANVSFNERFASVGDFWNKLVEVAEKHRNVLTTDSPLSTLKKVSTNPEESPKPETSEIDFVFEKPLAIVCVCDSVLSRRKGFNPSKLAAEIAKKGTAPAADEPVLRYQEPECTCHTMDAGPSVKCPSAVRGLKPQGPIMPVAQIPVYKLDDLGGYKVKRDAPYLRPYITQSKTERCLDFNSDGRDNDTNSDVISINTIWVPCNKSANVALANGRMSRIVSCAVIPNFNVTAASFLVDLNRRTTMEPRSQKIFEYLGKDGELLNLAQNLSISEDPTSPSRTFKERMGDVVELHPSKLSA